MNFEDIAHSVPEMKRRMREAILKWPFPDVLIHKDRTATETLVYQAECMQQADGLSDEDKYALLAYTALKALERVTANYIEHLYLCPVRAPQPPASTS